jgi:hypothetical protein
VASDQPLCGSRLKQARDDGRTTCNNQAGFRTDHTGAGRCFLHGGRTPSGKAFAKGIQAEQIMRTYGIDNPIPTDPAEGLLLEIARTAGHIQWLAAQLGELAPIDLHYGEKSFTASTGFESGEKTVVGPGAHVLLEQYQRERSMFVKVCAEAIRADIGTRQIRLWEDLGGKVGQILTAVLDGLALTDEQVARVPDLIERHLRLIA